MFCAFSSRRHGRLPRSSSAGSPVSAQPIIMAAPSHPAVLPSGPGKALALVRGGGGQIQPVPVLQSTPQPSVTMVRVVTHPLASIPLNGYCAASLGGAEGNGDFRGTEMCCFRSKTLTIIFFFVWFYAFVSISFYLLFPPLEQKPSRSESG